MVNILENNIIRNQSLDFNSFEHLRQMRLLLTLTNRWQRIQMLLRTPQLPRDLLVFSLMIQTSLSIPRIFYDP